MIDTNEIAWAKEIMKPTNEFRVVMDDDVFVLFSFFSGIDISCSIPSSLRISSWPVLLLCSSVSLRSCNSFSDKDELGLFEDIDFILSQKGEPKTPIRRISSPNERRTNLQILRL